MQKIRIGMLGLGGVAQVHWLAYRDEPWIEVVSACDMQRDLVDAFCSESGAIGFGTVDELLDFGNIDLALVLTPAATHRRLCEQVARAGVHVFSEKPLALTRDDAEAVLTTCCENGVQLFYGSCYRYLPAFSKAREIIAAGQIGAVKLLTEHITGGMGPAHYHEYGPTHYPLGEPGGPGMGLLDHGIHLVDIIPWLCDSTITRASGHGVRSGEGPAVEHMTMQLANGAQGHLLYYTASWFTHLPNEAHVTDGLCWAADASVLSPGSLDPHPGCLNIYGDEGALRVFHYGNAVYRFDDSGLERITLDGRASPGHFTSQLEDCASAIFDGTTPKVDGADGLRALDQVLRVFGM